MQQNRGEGCRSEGSAPIEGLGLPQEACFDSGTSARLGKRLTEWNHSSDGQLEIIRPGTFEPNYIRETGLKKPILIKGDRFNENPQMGLMWQDVHSISVELLSDYIKSDCKVTTWDVVKQQPGPFWTLSQWCTYWHARQELSQRPPVQQKTVAAAVNVNDDSDDMQDEADSNAVIVLKTLGALQNPLAAKPQVGISPEQTQRLLDAEYLPLQGTQLTQHIHPPPALQSVDLVRMVERHMDKSAVPGISPADTLHLQMAPKGCFSDFRQAPRGATTWLYVLCGRKEVMLLPPTEYNRRLFLSWGLASRVSHPKSRILLDVFLADYAQEPVKVAVKQGQALVIPAGWMYATATPEACLAVGCFFWHPYALADAARAQQMELQLRLRPQYEVAGRNLLWCAAAHYAKVLRDKLGLPAYKAAKPPGAAGAAEGTAQRSTSQGSLNIQQQWQRSPRITGIPGSGAAAAASKGRLTPRATPPMMGMPGWDQQHELDGGLSVPRSQQAGKRLRDEHLEPLILGEPALGTTHMPGRSAAAAAVGAPGVQAPKRLKLSTSKPGTPRLGGTDQGAGAAAAGAVTPRSALHSGSRGAAAAADGRQQQPGGSTPRRRQQHQQQQQRSGGFSSFGGYSRSAAAAGDDDDEGECHTSPVRHPEHFEGYHDDDMAGSEQGHGAAGGPYYSVQRAAAAGRQQQQQRQSTGTKANITSLKIKMPGHQHPLYSPVLQGMKGDADCLPPISCGGPALGLPAAAGADGGGADMDAGQSLAAAAAAVLAAATGGAPTPTAKKFRLQMKKSQPGTPSAAVAQAKAAAGASLLPGPMPGAAAASPAPSPDPADAPAAAGTGAVTAVGSSPRSTSAAAGAVTTGLSRRTSPEDSSAGSHAIGSGGASQQDTSQPQQLGSPAHTGAEQQQQQASGHPDVLSQPLQHQVSPVLPPSGFFQRRSLDGADAKPGPTAVPGAADGKSSQKPKLKLKLPSPSPKLGHMPAPTGMVPPQLRLGQAALQGQLPPQPPAVSPRQPVQQQQWEQIVPAIPTSIPQLDGIAEQWGVHSKQQLGGQCLQQHQQHQCMRSQGSLWARWQQLQGAMHSQQQAPRSHKQAGAALRAIVPQSDGAADDECAGGCGPTLLLQPAAAPTGGSGATAIKHASGEQQPQQESQQVHVAESSVVAGGGSRRNTPPPMELQQGVQQHPAVLPPKQQRPPLFGSSRKPAAGAPGHILQQQHKVAGSTAGVAGSQLISPQPAAITKNPVVQSQVHKQRQAACAAVARRSSSPSPEACSPFAEPNPAVAAACGSSEPPALLEAASGVNTMLGECTAGGISRAGSSLPAAELGGGASSSPAPVAAGNTRITSAAAPAPSSPVGQGLMQLQEAPGRAVSAALGSVGFAGQLRGSVTAATTPQQPMLPPQPTKASSWELAELPVLHDFLAEQGRDDDEWQLPGLPSPKWMLEQLQEAVVAAKAHETEEIATRAAAAAMAGAAGSTPSCGKALQQPQLQPSSNAAAAALQVDDSSVAGKQQEQQQQPAEGAASRAAAAAAVAMVEEMAAAAAHWASKCGPLFIEPLKQVEMPRDFADACQQGYSLQALTGAVSGLDAHDATTTEVVAETNPLQTTSLDGQSAGSYGGSREGATSRGTAKAARAAAAVAGSMAVGGGIGTVAGRGTKRPAVATSAQIEQQVQQGKLQGVRKKIGLMQGSKRRC